LNEILPWQVLGPWYAAQYAVNYSQIGTMAATSGNDWVLGTAGDDILDGGAGADTMVGGTGDDAYYVDDVGDVVGENADEGIDSVYSSVSYTLSANLEDLYLYLADAAVMGTGNDLGNLILGSAYNDTIVGLGGDDLLNGYLGRDTLIGGIGNDIYRVDNAGDVIIELSDEGIDTVYSSVSHTLAANVENLILEAGATAGTGNDLNNHIKGNDAGNRLDGGVGADTLIGGTGYDDYYVDNTGDVVIDKGGYDAVYSSIDYTLGDTIEKLYLTGSAIVGIGNDLDNLIQGNSQNNILIGGFGSDVIFGGFEADTLIGGVGNDTYSVHSASTVVIEDAGSDYDTVDAGVNYTLPANVERLYLIGSAFIGIGNDLDNQISGNNHNNSLVGGAGNDYLYGGSGIDTMIGGTGDDTFSIDRASDLIIEDAGGGTDIVIVYFENYTLGNNLERLYLMEAASGNGNELDNYIRGYNHDNSIDGGLGNDTLDGNAGNDTLNGGTGNDSLIGGSGNDYLNGGAGADTMVGGLGDDSYFVDSTTDRITELAGEGSDTVNASVNWTLGANIEKLVLTGSAVRGIGNTLNNTIQGNAASNILNGGSGSDTLSGGAGADQFEIGSAHTGRDTIVDFVSGEDQIALSGFGLDMLEEGYNFIVNSGPSGAYATLLYNTTTGILSFDEDGTGAAASREVALLSNKAALTSADFFVF
jgi:Ca2+-binding RTX toxin-like protein